MLLSKAYVSGLRVVVLLVLSLLAINSHGWDESITYIHQDHLGSPVLGTDENGNVLWNQDFRAYGQKTTASDHTQQSPDSQRVGFTGHMQEPNYGLVYMQGRWYHPELERFTAVDPITFRSSNVHSFNRYVYGNSNPYRYVDPDGLNSRDAVLAELGEGYDSGAQARQGVSIVTGTFDNIASFVDEQATDLMNYFGGAAVKAGAGVLKIGLPFVPMARGNVPKGVNPSSIKFSQPTVSQNFSSNGTINDLIAGLKNGTVKPGDVPAIRVVERNGELITLDNRRLAAFKAAGVSVPIQRVSLSNPKIAAEFAKKYNPVNGGQHIVVTPNAAGRSAAEAILRQHGKIR